MCWKIYLNPLEISSQDGTNQSREILDWSESGIAQYKERLEVLRWEKKEDTESQLEYLLHNINKSVKKRIAKSEIKKVSQRWWDEECWIKKKRVRLKLNEWRKGRGSAQEYQTERREYKTLCKEKKKKSQEEEIKELKMVRSEREAWKYITKFRHRYEEISESISEDDWSKHFREILVGHNREDNINKIKRLEMRDDDITFFLYHFTSIPTNSC